MENLLNYRDERTKDVIKNVREEIKRNRKEQKKNKSTKEILDLFE